MGHRIRVAIHAGGFEELSGDVEVDETFIGGNTILGYDIKILS
jgi:hypothetical protein